MHRDSRKFRIHEYSYSNTIYLSCISCVLRFLNDHANISGFSILCIIIGANSSNVSLFLHNKTWFKEFNKNAMKHSTIFSLTASWLDSFIVSKYCRYIKQKSPSLLTCLLLRTKSSPISYGLDVRLYKVSIALSICLPFAFIPIESYFIDLKYSFIFCGHFEKTFLRYVISSSYTESRVLISWLFDRCALTRHLLQSKSLHVSQYKYSWFVEIGEQYKSIGIDRSLWFDHIIIVLWLLAQLFPRKLLQSTQYLIAISPSVHNWHANTDFEIAKHGIRRIVLIFFASEHWPERN